MKDIESGRKLELLRWRQQKRLVEYQPLFQKSWCAVDALALLLADIFLAAALVFDSNCCRVFRRHKNDQSRFTVGVAASDSNQ
jgi:Tfp pilus assembly protein PilN